MPTTTAPERKAVQVAVGVVARGGRVLVTRRREGQLLSGWWEFPGGKIERGESSAQAMVRELREEVGLVITPVASLAEILHEYPHAVVHLHPHLGSCKSGEAQAIEVAECRWVTREELAQLAMLPGNKSLVDGLLADWSVVDAVG